MKQANIYDYQDPVLFMRDRISYLKMEHPSYSISRICRGLRRCSPSLISNILSGKRRITEDRLRDIATVLKLQANEREVFAAMVRGEIKDHPKINETQKNSKRRRVSSFILNDWINPFVKDAFRLASVKSNLESIYEELSNLATRKRINRSIEFLVKQGYLKRNQAGQLEESEPLQVVGDLEADRKIKHFHKQTLEIAKKGIDRFSIDERLAQAMIMPVDAESYQELKQLITGFSEQLKIFSEKHETSDERLYQLILHLTPTGGSK